MTIFLAYILRLLVIFSGFALASIAASVFFVVVGIIPLGRSVDGSGLDAVLNAASLILLMGITVAAVSSALLLIPVFILALFSEYFSWNTLLFHCVFGAILGGSATGFWQMSRAVEGEGYLVMVGIAAGIIGAYAYWLVAGRNSGKLFAQIIAARQKVN